MDYQARLKRHLRIELKTFKSPARGGEAPGKLLAREGEKILAMVPARHQLVALDVGGRPLSSTDLAKRLQGWMSSGHQGICFAVGSAHGLAPEVKDRADLRWSLGPATLPHDLAMVVMWEQLYRAMTIIRGEPYHKE
jgi:23S rRNA (pseudouridine1915-N3)-methyltransferase